MTTSPTSGQAQGVESGTPFTENALVIQTATLYEPDHPKANATGHVFGIKEYVTADFARQLELDRQALIAAMSKLTECRVMYRGDLTGEFTWAMNDAETLLAQLRAREGR